MNPDEIARIREELSECIDHDLGGARHGSRWEYDWHQARQNFLADIASLDDVVWDPPQAITAFVAHAAASTRAESSL